MECALCQHRCKIDPGGTGRCRVRGDVGGKVGLLTYGRVTTAILGPIEQKLIYHFRPGSTVLSIGGSGCNMTCSYCQNFEISQVLRGGEYLSPSQVAEMAIERGASGVAFSYSEPLVMIEYVEDVFLAARAAGLATILKTNGFCEERAFGRVCGLSNAVNIDIKGTARMYREVCGVDLPSDPAGWPMIRNLRIAASACACASAEASIVAIPGYEESAELFSRVADAAPDAAIHILRFFPDFRMKDVPPADHNLLMRVSSMARSLFSHVYVDFAGYDNDTFCACGAVLVSRRGLDVKDAGWNACPECGRASPIRR